MQLSPTSSGLLTASSELTCCSNWYGRIEKLSQACSPSSLLEYVPESATFSDDIKAKAPSSPMQNIVRNSGFDDLPHKMIR